METFEAGLVAAGGVTACNGPLSSTTASACFSAGALLPGVTYSAVPGTLQPNMVVLGAGFIDTVGNASRVLGPNNMISDTFNLTFDAANAVGFDVFVFQGLSANNVLISVFSPTSILLNSFSISALRGPNFFGVISDAGAIGRIDVEARGELIDNLAFGSVPEPAIYTLLASGLGLAGLLKLRRRI